jgi:2-iminobutanoate/2-iminopropanoate deaminase
MRLVVRAEPDERSSRLSPIFHVVEDGPSLVAPYSHVVEVDDWLFVTGQLATGVDDTSPLPAGIEDQTRKVMENLRIVLHGVGANFADAVQVRIFLTHFERDYDAMNAIYRDYFDSNKLPARTTVGVTALARGGLIEIDMIAKRSEGHNRHFLDAGY